MIACNGIEAILNLPSPLQRINLLRSDRKVYIKRDDLIHPWLPGNKWRKLKYHVAEEMNITKSGIVTFGGAFSNHIHATAALGRLMNFPTIGIIRGESQSIANPTLSFCSKMGMKLHFIDRAEYRRKESSKEVQSILTDHPSYHIVREGGEGPMGAKGISEICDEIDEQVSEKNVQLYCAIGTGTTYAGLSDHSRNRVTGINVLKNTGIEESLCSTYNLMPNDIVVHHQYHRGGYAKYDEELIDYIHSFYVQSGIILDHVYMAKLMLAIEDLAIQDRLPKHTVVYHSGGQQGLLGLDYMNPGLIRSDIVQSLKNELDISAKQ